MRINHLTNRALEKLRTGSLNDALVLILEAKSYRDQVRDVEFVHGLCLISLGLKTEALHALREEVANYPDNAVAERMLLDLEQELQLPSPPKTATQSIQTESELDVIIPAEVKNDAFAEAIRRLAGTERIKTVLEIGSSSGGGSTEAFVAGLSENPNNPTLFCMEISQPRFAALRERYSQHGFVQCYNLSSIAPEQFPSEQEVRDFYRSHPTVLNNYPEEQVLGWLGQDLEYLRQAGAHGNGIEQIKLLHNILNFDMVLIDGSEFTGEAEFNHIYGARLILLDDTNSYKNFRNRERLLADPLYTLIEEDLTLRSGYSIFRRIDEQFPIHFFTIVLNGLPFIQHHIDEFKKLTVPWHWHIVEGVAALVRDTAWSLQFGAQIVDELHCEGLSNDGTSEYLDTLQEMYPENITVYRRTDGQFWDGKVEMVNAPLSYISGACLLWQLDSDELWTQDQIETMRRMFLMHPERTGAYTHCHYFVGPRKYVSDLDSWATRPFDWPRVWNFVPGMRWTAHEPATLVDLSGRDVMKINPFTRDETLQQRLSFHHFSYATEEQVRFKERYYGYRDAVTHWKELQKTTGPVNPRHYLPWANYDATVEDWPEHYGPTLGDRFFSARRKKIKIAGQDNDSGKDLTQIDKHSQFAEAIGKLLGEIRPQRVIETGTYLGLGTTKVIAETLLS